MSKLSQREMTLQKVRKRPRFERLVQSDEGFETEIVRSVLDFYNDCLAERDQPAQPVRVGQIVENAFSWVPSVIGERARRAGIDPANVRWRETETAEDILVAASVVLYQVAAFKESVQQYGTTDARGRRISAEQWREELLKSLPIVSRFTIERGKTHLVSVPCLTGVQQCVAYALALLDLRRDLARRVRPCAYLRNPSPGSLAHHYFLAHDMRQRFCRPAHSNAQRQREWRRDQATRSKPRKRK